MQTKDIELHTKKGLFLALRLDHYSENGRKSDIDIEDRAIRTAIETMRMLIAKDKECG